jgi:hypothetical protein
MAQSQPFIGRLEPFYGWYKRVSSQLPTKKPKSKTKIEKLNEKHISNFIIYNFNL